MRLVRSSICALLLLFPASTLQAAWMMLDEFDGLGPIGGDTWYQATELDYFHMGNGRLHVNTGKAKAFHRTFPGPDDFSRVRFEAYSGETDVGTRNELPQTVSALVGAKSEDSYYEIRLLSDNLLTTDFYRLHFYSVLNGVPTNDMTINFDEKFDALRLEAFFDGSTVSVSVQPIDRTTGADLGTPIQDSFQNVPAALANDPQSRLVGLAAQGQYISIDNFEGFAVPEVTTFILLLLGCLPILRPSRRPA